MWQRVHFLSVENDSSESEYVKYMQGAIIENLFGEVEFISGYIYIYFFLRKIYKRNLSIIVDLCVLRISKM